MKYNNSIVSEDPSKRMKTVLSKPRRGHMPPFTLTGHGPYNLLGVLCAQSDRKYT
jgi:hypothetical protein